MTEKTAYKILVTGATGFVGSHLARAFVQDGHEVHILVREQSPNWRIQDSASHLTPHRCDVLDASAVATVIEVIQPDYIFHCANAGVYGGMSVSDHDLLATNTVGLMNLLLALRSIPYRGFINFGSSSEYGPKEAPMKETDVCEPANFYGVTKLAATGVARLEGILHDKPIMTLRLFSPFGPYDDHRRLISRTITDLLAHRTVHLRNPDARRDYIFIDDVVALCRESMTRVGIARGEVYNVGSGIERRIREVIDELVRIMDVDSSLVQWSAGTPGKDESPRWEADVTKTTAVFSWQPRHSLEDGLQKTYEWMKVHAGETSDFTKNP